MPSSPVPRRGAPGRDNTPTMEGGGDKSCDMPMMASRPRHLIPPGATVEEKMKGEDEEAEEEMVKLQNVIPTLSHISQVCPVTIVREATKYIGELHIAIGSRLHELGFRTGSVGGETDVPSTMQHLIPRDVFLAERPSTTPTLWALTSEKGTSNFPHHPRQT